MATVHSIRELHSQLDIVCSSLEAMQHWIANECQPVESAQFPVIQRFRELLDLGDKIAGPDIEVQS